MLPKSQNWILMLALFLAAPAMRSPITVPRNQSRDDRETLAGSRTNPRQAGSQLFPSRASTAQRGSTERAALVWWPKDGPHLIESANRAAIKISFEPLTTRPCNA
ncbi:MAG: hypothetical protein ABSH00_03665 [Bryobacteraceae bacterium]|jgi:hypothetical protein